MIESVISLKEAMAKIVRAKLISQNTYLLTCVECGKEWVHLGVLGNYRYRFLYSYINSKKNHECRVCYACSWTCYVKALLENTTKKKTLSAQDVLMLIRYHKEVPWDRVAKVAYEQLPDKRTLEAMLWTNN